MRETTNPTTATTIIMTTTKTAINYNCSYYNHTMPKKKRAAKSRVEA
jgi:hypothetical protein